MEVHCSRRAWAHGSAVRATGLQVRPDAWTLPTCSDVEGAPVAGSRQLLDAPPTPLSSLVTPLPPHVHDRLTSLSDGVRPSLMSKRAVRLGEFRCSDAMLVQPAPRARASSRHS